MKINPMWKLYGALTGKDQMQYRKQAGSPSLSTLKLRNTVYTEQEELLTHNGSLLKIQMQTSTF